MCTRHSGTRGFTLVEIMIVVALIGLLMAIAIPSFVKARRNAQKNTCVNNLRVIDAIKQQWALEKRRSHSDSPTSIEVLEYINRGGGQGPVCPASGSSGTFATSYKVNPVGLLPECRIDGTTHVMPP